MADPGSLISSRADEVEALRERARRTTVHRLDRAVDEIAHHRARARALSPLATLQRGYAVLQGEDGHVLTSVADVAKAVRRLRAGRRRTGARAGHDNRGDRWLTRRSPTSRPARSSSRWSARLEAGGTTLEESLALWERGEQLATICQEWLDGARARLDAARGDEG